MLRRTGLTVALALVTGLGGASFAAPGAPRPAPASSVQATAPHHVLTKSLGAAEAKVKAKGTKAKGTKAKSTKAKSTKAKGAQTKPSRAPRAPGRATPLPLHPPGVPHAPVLQNGPVIPTAPVVPTASTPPYPAGTGGSSPSPAGSVSRGARVTRQGTQLLLDGQPWQYTGFNAFGATTWYGTNWGCGSPVYDLDRMFDQLRPGSVVRTWAFQALAWSNKGPQQHEDWSAIDRVVQAAERHHQLLTLTLSDQSGTCDDGKWHDPDWYRGGYQQRWNDDGRGLSDRSYADYVKAIVARYKDSPAIAFWEPVNEAEASTCNGARGTGCFDSSKRWCPPDSATILKDFFTDIGAQIRAIDPHHLIAAGVGGGGQCGVESGRYTEIGQSPGVDLMTYHDYGTSDDPYPSGLADRRRQAFTEIGKPIAVEEVGITGGGCRSNADRARLYQAKVDAAFLHGISGYTPWWYSEGPSGCGDDFGPGDPLLAVLAEAAR